MSRSAEPQLVAAMARVASREGYGGASVARVVAEAGVSRATFYQYFRDRAGCFAVAYQHAARQLAETIHRAPDAEGASSLRSKLDAFLGWAAANPDSARLILIEVMAAPQMIRAEHERLRSAVESAVEQHLREPTDRGALQISATCLLAGIEAVAAARVLEGRTTSLPELADELQAWIESYRLPKKVPRWTHARWEILGRRVLAA